MHITLGARTDNLRMTVADGVHWHVPCEHRIVWLGGETEYPKFERSAGDLVISRRSDSERQYEKVRDRPTSHRDVSVFQKGDIVCIAHAYPGWSPKGNLICHFYLQDDLFKVWSDLFSKHMTSQIHVEIFSRTLGVFDDRGTLLPHDGFSAKQHVWATAADIQLTVNAINREASPVGIQQTAAKSAPEDVSGKRRGRGFFRFGRAAE